MSLKDHAEVRRIFKPFNIHPVHLRYSVMRSAVSRRQTGELLIRSY